jgi:hypothetical protein
MTPMLAALAMVMFTGALLLEERSWQRTRRLRAAASSAVPRTLRCLCCEGTPLVDDMATHSRLVHQPRVRGAEDFQEWSA